MTVLGDNRFGPMLLMASTFCNPCLRTGPQKQCRALAAIFRIFLFLRNVPDSTFQQVAAGMSACSGLDEYSAIYQQFAPHRGKFNTILER
jgi:hypothetical protein